VRSVDRLSLLEMSRGMCQPRKDGIAMVSYSRAGPKRSMADVCHHVRARAPGAESTTIVTAAGTEKMSEVFELEAEVLLTASDQSLKVEMAATTAADAMAVMIAIDTMTAIVNMTAMTAADVVIKAEIVDVPTVDTRFMRSTITLQNLDLRVMAHLWLSAGRRL
jgi:hypothetical protein